ncbi:hypothetical protein [Paucihalobacter sp.]|uniref:hypothetical protein n=1 Tax=Paucihalobacter sp. TaxID=2850405 RepID=UPI003D161710
MSKRILKIVRLYIISLLCIAFYFYLENSSEVPELVEFSNKLRYKGFATFFLTGLLKYGLLIIGLSMTIITTFMLIKEKVK